VFTYLSGLVALLALLLGLIMIVLGLTAEPQDLRGLFLPSGGAVVVNGAYAILFGLALGTFAEISSAVCKASKKFAARQD
jgi:hypothetical protein